MRVAVIRTTALSALVTIAALTPAQSAAGQRVDTITAGRQTLNTANYRARVDTIDAYNVQGTTRRLTGTSYVVYEAAPAGSGGEYLVRNTTPGGSVATTILRAETLMPVRNRNQAT